MAVIVSLRPSGEDFRSLRGGDLVRKASSGLRWEEVGRDSCRIDAWLDTVVLPSEGVALGASKGGITVWKMPFVGKFLVHKMQP